MRKMKDSGNAEVDFKLQIFTSALRQTMVYLGRAMTMPGLEVDAYMWEHNAPASDWRAISHQQWPLYKSKVRGIAAVAAQEKTLH